jgi:ABC-2 type transport system permease protein
MNDFITVYSAEVLRRLRSRSFKIGLIVGALGIVVMFRLPAFLNSYTEHENRIVLAGDAAVISAARPLLAKDFNISALRAGALHPTEADLNRDGKASAAIVLQRASSGLRASIYAKNPGAIDTSDLRRDLLPLTLSYATRLPERRVTALMKFPVDVHPLGSKFSTAAQADQARLVANVLIFLLYLLIVLNSQLIITSVAEEKTSRIAELLVASVRPSTLLAGKIAASATLAILQMALWVVIGIATGAQLASSSHAETTAPAQTLSMTGIAPIDVAGFLVFFLIGYLQMSTMFAALGSLINRTEDIGSIAGPFFIPIVAALLIAVTALQAPDASFVVATSFIPLIAPFVMFARIVVSTVPAWEVGLSLAINLAAIYAIAIIAGKVYRMGMLLYGRPPKLRQLITALRAE